eukprot:433535_1
MASIKTEISLNNQQHQMFGHLKRYQKNLQLKQITMNENLGKCVIELFKKAVIIKCEDNGYINDINKLFYGQRLLLEDLDKQYYDFINKLECILINSTASNQIETTNNRYRIMKSEEDLGSMMEIQTNNDIVDEQTQDVMDNIINENIVKLEENTHCDNNNYSDEETEEEVIDHNNNYNTNITNKYKCYHCNETLES